LSDNPSPPNDEIQFELDRVQLFYAEYREQGYEHEAANHSAKSDWLEGFIVINKEELFPRGPFRFVCQNTGEQRYPE
jgi:hypothetical protein